MSRPILTVRVTNIEAFRMFIYGQTEKNETYINEPNLISTIKGESRVNVKADYGSAGHSLIERPNWYRTGGIYQVKDFTFTYAQARPMLKFCAEHPLMTREIPLSKLYSTSHFDLIVTGTCDHLEGNVIRDTKFKFGNFDMADFMDSVQWRLYLDMIGLDIFWYDFFRVSKFEKIEDCSVAVISECESMMLKRYDSMDTDIQSILQEFADFIVFKGLEKHLAITGPKYKKIIAGDYRLKKLIA